MKRLWSVLYLGVLTLVVLAVPNTASAQVGSIAGTVRDDSDSVVPGVTVEVSSPALIEKVRSTVTDSNGRYQLTALSVGTYSVTFTLTGFSTVKRDNVVVTSDFTATVSPKMSVGAVTQVVEVKAEAPIVNSKSPTVQQVLQGGEIADLPTQRDIPSLLNLVPGFQTSTLRGVCSGGVGGFCNPTVPLFNAHTGANDTDGQNQGRIMVDGMSINMGRAGTGINENVGQANGIVLNTAAAQEVSFTLSGSLGESETGGAAINLVPRTGGNRYSGNYSVTYTQSSFFDRNTGTRNTWSPTAGRITPAKQGFVYDYDMTGAFGGPVKKDRLWFYLQARKQDRQTYTGGSFVTDPAFLNLNAGKFAANYVPFRDCTVSAPRDCADNGQMTNTNEYKNASLRLTLQASQKNKINLYWDEQDACTNPCYGMVSAASSPEGYFSLMSRPNRLLQASWTNPFTNKLLFEAGLTAVLTHQDQTRSREFENPQSIPRLCESGDTVGRDEVAGRLGVAPSFFLVQQFGAGSCFGALTSGSLNDFLGNLNVLQNDDTYRSRATASYITGAHNIKLGWEGAYFAEKTTNTANDLRLTYHYTTPVTTVPGSVGFTAWNPATRTGSCYGVDPAQYACGNMSLYYPEDPNNWYYARPYPIGVDVNTGTGTLDERVWFGAIYLQDQWTYNRWTLSGALRYDHAKSRYGGTCVGPDRYVPTGAVLSPSGQELVPAQSSGQWCSDAQDGVSYDDITPRGGVAWDVFGTGKTAVKVNVGKYLQAAGFGGLYTGFNDARRSTNQITRMWNDINGNRIFDCDMTRYDAYFSPQGDFCGSMLTAGTTNPSATFLQFGRPPNASQLSNNTASCGLPHSNATQIEYCDLAGQNLMSGWNKRRNEWQFGLGVQHELLPRMSVEVTYNRRKYGNLTDTDTVNQGCDYFQVTGTSALPASACTDGWQHYTDPTGLRDFYTFTVPNDPRLPNGGGYTVLGLNNQKASGALPGGNGGVVLIRDELGYSWAGFDTNVVMRARGGLRLSGGTSTGRTNRNTCSTNIDSPNVQGRTGAEFLRGCITQEPLLTNIRGNVSYTIPWIDVLASGVFRYQPGPEINATMTVQFTDVVWEPESANRQGLPFTTATSGGSSNTASIQLLNNRDMYGEGMRMFDLTLRKNIRFANKRVSIGADVYNIFNSDAPLGYQATYTATKVNGDWVQGNPNTGALNDWRRITSITSPRFARFSLNFDF